MNHEAQVRCPVCDSDTAYHIRDVPTIRTGREIPLYHCVTCHSFCNPSGYIEDEEQSKKDLEWHISVAERNRLWARDLFDQLLRLKPGLRSVLEVGCGIGTALKVAADEHSLDVFGYDLQGDAIDWGSEHYGIPLYSKTWHCGESPPTDLTLCISVLEHIGRPLPLIQQLCEHTKRSGGVLFLSVPFFDPEKWHFVDDPDPALDGTPFFDNDVHITHFSRVALVEALRGQGLSCRHLCCGGWSGILADADPPAERREEDETWYQEFIESQRALRERMLRPGEGSRILTSVYPEAP